MLTEPTLAFIFSGFYGLPATPQGYESVSKTTCFISHQPRHQTVLDIAQPQISRDLLKELPRGDTLSRPQSFFQRTIVEATKVPDLVPHCLRPGQTQTTAF